MIPFLEEELGIGEGGGLVCVCVLITDDFWWRGKEMDLSETCSCKSTKSGGIFASGSEPALSFTIWDSSCFKCKALSFTLYFMLLLPDVVLPLLGRR